MAEQSQDTMAKIGASLSWRDLDEEERRAEGRPPQAERTVEPEIVGDFYDREPRMFVPDGVEEDYDAAERRARWPRDGWGVREDTAAASRGLIVAALLVFIAVAALLGVAIAV
jgi:hypothetical protein